MPSPPLVRPPGVSKVAVCSESGDLPNVWCSHLVGDLVHPRQVPIKVSQLHRAVAMDTVTGRLACPPYSPQTTRFEVFEFWGSDMLRLFRDARHAAACAAGAAVVHGGG